jgi:hypothetical protein
MGTYEPQDFIDTFGGLPERGEAAIDPREVADMRRDHARVTAALPPERPPGMPANVRKLYDELDTLCAVLEDPWSTEDARARACQRKADVELALTNYHA